MALNSRIKGPLPEKGVIVARRKGDVPRVYHVLETFRNEKGQPTNKRKLIGKLDEESGMLVPNDAYYEFYDAAAAVEELPEGKAVTAPLAEFLASRILEDLGASAMLEDAFGREDARSISLVAAYMLSRGNVMQGAADWCAECVLGDGSITSQSTSALFAGLTREKRMAFFRSWAASLAQSEYLAYDVTSVSSYSEGISDLEWGYNRDGERLPQLNLGMYLGRESGLPAFYRTYPGSIVDKSHLPYMMADNAEVGIGADGVTFVMDKGFCTTANVEYMSSERYRYVIGVDGRHKATRQAIESVRATVTSSANRLPGGVHAQRVHGRFYGATSDLHVFFDDDLARRQRLDLYRRVDADREELAQLSDLSGRDVKRLSRFHSIDVADDGSFSFAEDHAAVDAAAANSGFFCLLTNDGALSCADVLAIYRDKDAIEKGFDELKNHLDMSRLRTHADETTEGKVFCAFVSLIVVMHMQRELAQLMGKKNLTKKRVLAELEKAKVVTTASGKRLMNPLTRLQKDILAPFGVTEDDFKEFVATA